MRTRKYRLKTDYSFLTLKESLYHACEAYAEKTAYIQPLRGKGEITCTYQELFDNIMLLGAQLLHWDALEHNIAIIGENSIQWMSAYLSIVCGGGVAVPLDKELDFQTLDKQLEFSDCETVFLSSSYYKKNSSIIARHPNVKKWIVMGGDAVKADEGEVYGFDEVLDLGKTLSKTQIFAYQNRKVAPEDLCEIIFTSGTTGANKGVMLSNKNVCTNMHGALTHIELPERSIACLPVNHAFEKNCHVLIMLFCGKTVVINDSPMHLFRNIQKYNAEASVLVPQILATIKQRIEVEAKKAGVKEHLDYGIKVSRILRKFHIDQRERYFEPILSGFGRRFRLMIVGGAFLDEEMRAFLDDIGITVVNGYGITECSPLVSANYTRFQKPGSVGRPIPGCEIRIVDPDETGKGAICVKSDGVMLGYYKGEEETRSVLSEDGWFRTGDIGYMDRAGFLYLSGREKNLIILANGKNVLPEELEERVVREIPAIQDIVVYEDKNEKGIYASVYMNPEYVTEHEIQDSYQYVMEHIQTFNKHMPAFKQINDVAIVDEPFEKTTTQKIKRASVKRAF